MASNLSNYESQEIGKARMDQLRAHGKHMLDIVNKMYSLAVNYDGYRNALDPVADAEDIVYSDASLTYAVDQAKPIVDQLTVEQKAWLDLVMDGLGYEPKVV